MEFKQPECWNESWSLWISCTFSAFSRFSFFLSKWRRIIPALCIANVSVMHWERSCSANTPHLCTALTSLFVSAYQSRSLFLCGDPIETPWLSRTAPDSHALFDCCLATALSLKSCRRFMWPFCVRVRLKSTSIPLRFINIGNPYFEPLHCDVHNPDCFIWVTKNP